MKFLLIPFLFVLVSCGGSLPVIGDALSPEDVCGKIFTEELSANICRVEQSFTAEFISLKRQLVAAQAAGDVAAQQKILDRGRKLSSAKASFREGQAFLSGEIPVDAVLDELEKQLENQQ